MATSHDSNPITSPTQIQIQNGTPSDESTAANSMKNGGDLDLKQFEGAVVAETEPVVPHTLTMETMGKPAQQKWNSPRVNLYRVLAANFSFIIMGMNDAAYGALIPYLETYYKINYTVVSLVFLAPFFGYALAALLNNQIHIRYGQLGVATIAPASKLIAYAVTCAHPPYPVLPVVFVLSGFGNGLEDSGWNAWIGNMQDPNQIMGVLHGCYGLGATIGPLIATTLVTKGKQPWYTFYYIMLGLAAIEFCVCTFFFREATGAAYRAANAHAGTKTGGSRTRDALKTPVTWITAVLLLTYVGVEVSIGGWLVTFLLRVRHAEAFASGMVVTGFWLGLTFGRVILGFVTGRVGEKLAITVYMVICMALQLCFWLVPNFVASAVFVAWLGFFSGPLFPAAIVVATKLIPQELHVSAIGFAAASGGGGAALWPFAVGAIAQAKGVQVLQPIALALFAAILALWCMLPGGFTKKGLDDVQRLREAKRAGRVDEESSGQEEEKRGIQSRLRRLKSKLGLV